MSEDQGNPPEAEKFLALARQGKEAWNAWRRENPGENANFVNVDFTRRENQNINFGGFEFGDNADFSRSKFGIGLLLILYDESEQSKLATGGSPRGGAYFVGASFGNSANLSGASFGFWANLSGASFGEKANFSLAHFLGRVTFTAIEKVTEENGKEKIEKQPCLFNKVNFSRAKFDGPAEFTGCNFTGPTNFSYAEFATPPEFAGSEGHGYFDVTGMKISFTGDPPWVQPYWTHDTNIATRIRCLRKIMADIHAQDVERNLFILERQAERLPLLNRHPFRGAGAIILLGLYWLFSDYGRSICRPICWFIAQLAGFLDFIGASSPTSAKGISGTMSGATRFPMPSPLSAALTPRAVK
jgi:uncharacterized protein YjbI with pentapeptide repeats